MSLPPFELVRPAELSEAFAILTERGPDAVLYMGGTELLLAMKLGLARPSALVDGKGLSELKGVEPDGEWVTLGAGMTHLELESDSAIRELFPELASVERTVANIRVRSVGTIGGNLCFAEPHSDPATLLEAMGARVELASANGRRSLPIDDFVLGPLRTALDPGEIMTGIRLPLPERGERVAFERIRLKERPVANVAVRSSQDDVRVVVGAVGARPVRITAAEELLQETPDAIEEASELTAAAVEPFEDSEGSIEYKRHLVSVLTRRALKRVAA